jgi:putative hydrolase of the HAD superfamily
VSRVWVCDIDDTLYLEGDYVQSGFRAVAEWAEYELGVGGMYDVAWELFLTGTRNTTLTDAFIRLGAPLSPAKASKAIRVYRDHAPDIQLCPDASDFLSRVLDTARIAIVTDGPAASQRAKIDALGLASVADPIIVTSEQGADWHKPSPRSFLHIQRQLTASPEWCTYVADNPNKDFEGPKGLGWHTVRVMRAAGLHASVPNRPGEIDLTVTSLRELIDRMTFA